MSGIEERSYGTIGEYMAQLCDCYHSKVNMYIRTYFPLIDFIRISDRRLVARLSVSTTMLGNCFYANDSKYIPTGPYDLYVRDLRTTKRSIGYTDLSCARCGKKLNFTGMFSEADLMRLIVSLWPTWW